MRTSGWSLAVLMALGAWLGVGCTSDPWLSIYNSTGSALTTTVGEKSVTVMWQKAYTRVRVPLPAGTVIETRQDGEVIETVTVDASLADRNLIYNVNGASPLYLVEYSGAYAVEGGERNPTGSPLRIIASLEGESLYPAPKGECVDYTDDLPSVIVGRTPVYRVEKVVPSLARGDVEGYLSERFEREMAMLGASLFRR